MWKSANKQSERDRAKKLERDLDRAKKLLAELQLASDVTEDREKIFVSTDDSLLQDVGGMLLRISPTGEFELLEVEGGNAQSLVKW